MLRYLNCVYAKLLGILAVATVTVSCGSGGGLDAVLPPGVSSADIGPAGGTVTSFDGSMKMIVPPGALSTSKNITITQLNMSSLSPSAQAAQPKGAFSIGPSTLTFNLPVLIQWNVPLQEGVSPAASPVLDIMTFNDQFLASETLKYTQGASTGFLEASITGPGTVARFGLAGPGGLDLDIFAPSSLQTGQTPGSISPSLSVPGEVVGINSAAFVQWGVDPLNSAGLAFGIGPGAQAPFAMGTPLVNGQSVVLGDSTTLNCTLDGNYTYRVNLGLMGFDFPGLFQSRFGAAFGGMTTNYLVQVDLAVTCLPPTGGGGGGTGGMPQIQVFSLPLQGMRGLRRVPAGFPLPTAANPSFHQVMVSYLDGAACVQAEDGSVLYQVVAQTQGTYQQVAALPVPVGAQGNPAIALAGFAGNAVFDVDTATGMPFAQGTVSSPTFQPDVILTDEDPSQGGFVVDKFFGELLPLQFTPPWQVATQGQFFGIDLDTGAASSTGALLLVGQQGLAGGAALPEGQFLTTNLFFLDPTSTSGPVTVTTLGSLAGPLRGDPSSGIYALATAGTGFVQVILWDGINAPGLGGNVNVGLGSFFLDVFGNFIAVSNVTTGGVIMIEVDSQGQIISNTPIAFTGVQGNPSGIVFLRDSQNSVFVVTDQAEGVLISNAF